MLVNGIGHLGNHSQQWRYGPQEYRGKDPRLQESLATQRGKTSFLVRQESRSSVCK